MTLVEMSLFASFLILVIVVVRSLAIHKFPKVTFVVLWGIVLCRLFIPFSITSPVDLNAAVNKLNELLPRQPSPSVAFIQHILVAQTAPVPLQQPAPASHTTAILIIWGLGVTACALFFLLPHFRSRRDFKTAIPVDDRFIAEWLSSHKTVRPIRIMQFDRLSAPLTYGIFRPVILLPGRMDWTNKKQVQYILTHEFTHVKRLDALWKWLFAAGLCIHWFNPLVWVMYILANRDLELSCDEAVVRAYGSDQRSSYSLTLIGMEEKRSMQTLLNNNFSRTAIQERIHAIMKLKKVSRAGISAALLVVIVMTAACAATGPTKVAGPGTGSGHPLLATAVPQSTASPSGVLPSTNGNPLQAMPVSGRVIDITALSSQAKNVSEARDFIKSISFKGLFHRTIVIKFNQDMDANTLNDQNIIISEKNHSSIVNYVFNLNYDEKTRELHLDKKPDMNGPWPHGIGTGNVVSIYLTQNIKTAAGQSLNYDVVFTYDT